jgi:hypothetical protein
LYSVYPPDAPSFWVRGAVDAHRSEPTPAEPNQGRLAPHVRHPAVSANPSFVPEIVVGHADNVQPLLPLASNGILRWVWQSRYGAILIEVAGGEVFVNGQRVVPHAP